MGKLNVQIRRVKEEDFDRVFFLWVQDCGEVGFVGGPSVRESKGYVLGRCCSGKGFVAHLGRKDIFGFSFYGKPVEEGKSSGWLYNLYISPHFRRYGGGSKLVCSVAEEFRSQRISRMRLNLPDVGFEQAENFYRSLGFLNFSEKVMVHPSLRKLCSSERVSSVLRGISFTQAKPIRKL